MINPIFYPIFHPIATRLPHIFIGFQLIFHIPDPLQQKLSLDNTKRVLFCTTPEVDFEFLGYLTFWDTFEGSATANYAGIPSKNTLFQWEKVANELSGCTRVIETWLLLAVLKVPIGGDGSNIQYFQGFVGGAAI